jgi:hypothetical protein
MNSKTDELQNLYVYGWYKKGAIQMLLALEDLFKPSNVYQKAVFSMLKKDMTAIEKFILRDYDTIGYRNHKYKGKKLIEVEAYLAKRTWLLSEA